MVEFNQSSNTDSEQYKTGRVHFTMLLTSYIIKQILLSINKLVHNHIVALMQ